MHTLSKETVDLFSRALGDAVVRLRSQQSQDIQHRLFEETLNAGPAEMRAQLAQLLHGKHVHTSAGVAARAIVDPNSLGG